MTDKEEEKSKIPEEEQSRGFLDMGFFETIKWALIAGVLIGALTTGKEQLERFGRWIDGESSTMPIDSTTIDAYNIPGSRIVKTKSLEIGSFQFNIKKDWLTVESVNLNYIRSINRHYAYALSLSLGVSENKSPILLSIPKVYTVVLPNKAGHIFSLNQRVFFKVAKGTKEFVSAMDALSKQQRNNATISTGPGNFSPEQNVIISGYFDKDMVSANDIFDQALANQLSLMSSMSLEDFSLEIKRSRRSQKGSFTIAEIDYTYTMNKQPLRLNAVLYWHYKEGMPWGDLGIFIVDLNNKAALKNKKALKKTFLSVHLKDDDQEIWRNLNYDVSTDTEIMPFVHINIESDRLKAYGLIIKQVEEMLKSKLPTKMKAIEDIELITKDENHILLRDIALIHYLTQGDQKIQNYNSIILTVSQRY